MRFRGHLPALLLTGVFLLGVAAPARATAEGAVRSHDIRVLILEGPESVKLTIRNGYRITAAGSDRTLSASQSLPGVNVRARQGSLLVAGVKFPEAIDIYAATPADLYINDKPYRGSVSVYRQPDGTLTVVNRIDVEDYLYGVLYHEVGSWWPMESLKAQAIAARTYALHQKQFTAARKFDVYNNQSSQMYGGADSERTRSNEAVDSTRGLVLTYDGRIFPAYYHATCGGVTRSASELWKVDLPPLRGGVRCEYCWFSPHFSWHAKIGVREIESALGKQGVHVGSIRELEVVDRSPTGRVLTARVGGTEGERIISAKDLRLWVGSTVVRSENFEVHARRGKIVFEGKGWGHGVGMCQWGALGQSLIGRKYNEILSFYYPGSEIQQYYSDAS